MAGRLITSTLNDDTGVLATQNGMRGIAKAWVNYNGVSQIIVGSFNVSSVTRNGVGDYTVNFTSAMPNANYGIQATSSPTSSQLAVACVRFGTAPTTTQIRIQVGIPGIGFEDQTVVCVSIFSS